MRFDQKLITDENIHIDEDEFTNCTFVNCRIIFTGKGPTRFTNCRFDECQWVFDGPAENTIQYLAALYTGLVGHAAISWWLVRAAPEPPRRRCRARIRRSWRLPSHTNGVGAAFQPTTVSSNHWISSS